MTLRRGGSWGAAATSHDHRDSPCRTEGCADTAAAAFQRILVYAVSDDSPRVEMAPLNTDAAVGALRGISDSNHV